DRLGDLTGRPEVRVITLQRTNLLQTAVSQVIAERTDLWKTWDANKPLAEHYQDLPALDLDQIEIHMRWKQDEIARMNRAVASLDPRRVLRLTYEELYLSALPRRCELVDQLWSFLELPRCDDPEIQRFLSAS